MELAGYDTLANFNTKLNNKGEKVQIKEPDRRRASVASVARKLGADQSVIKKVALAWLSGGDEEVNRLRLGSGRPFK